MSDYAPSSTTLNGGRPTVMGFTLIAEAERLAYADRDFNISLTSILSGCPAARSPWLTRATWRRAALIPPHSMGSW